MSFLANRAQNEAVPKYVQTVLHLNTTLLWSVRSDDHFFSGALTSGKGSRLAAGSLASLPTDNWSRFILANTEQLHDKIIQMSERIRQLEDALKVVQAKCSSDPHPLLQQDSLRIKNSLELYSSHATVGRHVETDGMAKETHPSNFRFPIASSSTRDTDKVQDRRSEVTYFKPNSQADC